MYVVGWYKPIDWLGVMVAGIFRALIGLKRLFRLDSRNLCRDLRLGGL